jgi:heme exporter protein D
MGPAALFLPLLATDVAFFVLFGVFVVAIVALVVITMGWVIRRDRALRSAWRQRQAEAGNPLYANLKAEGTEGDDAATAPKT